MENVLGEIDEDYDCTKIYLGHLLVHTHTYEQHFEILKQIFWQFRNSNLLIDFDQSEFFMEEIEYLGYFIDSTGIWLTEKQANKLANINEPCSKRDVRKFLGLISRYKE